MTVRWWHPDENASVVTDGVVPSVGDRADILFPGTEGKAFVLIVSQVIHSVSNGIHSVQVLTREFGQ